MRKRLSFFFFLLLLGYALIIVRLLNWQVFSSDTLRGLLEQQTISKIVLTPKRGNIYASDGSPLVLNQRAYTVFATPDRIINRDQTALILSKELDIPIASISSKLTTKLSWVSLADKINDEKKRNLEKYNLLGIGFAEASRRFYPEASMAAHLLGFVGKNAKGEDTGYFGIEGFYDEQLRGRTGVLQQEQDSRGIPILFGRAQQFAPVDGRDLTLTIDKTVQLITEQRLKEGIEKYGAKGGTVIVMQPSTGAILATASYPSYDPDEPTHFPQEYFKNPAIASSYEPGSTFKVLVMGAALNENKVKLDSIFHETGSIDIGKYTINTWNQQYHGDITLSQVLEYSSNVGMVYVQRILGRDPIISYINKLGIGDLTGIDLQEESTPRLRSTRDWTEIDYATASFGQGIAVTPLQMIRAVAVIANGGKLVRPYVVKSIRTEQGKTIATQPTVDRVVFSNATTIKVAEMMVSAVQNGETKKLRPAGYRIAGKTGTAQIPIAGHYDTEKTIASFVGFAPIIDPRFIMLVTVSEPTASPWGSETAAPIFFAIAKELFSYYGISPTQ